MRRRWKLNLLNSNSRKCQTANKSSTTSSNMAKQNKICVSGYLIDSNFVRPILVFCHYFEQFQCVPYLLLGVYTRRMFLKKTMQQHTTMIKIIGKYKSLHVPECQYRSFITIFFNISSQFVLLMTIKIFRQKNNKIHQPKLVFIYLFNQSAT